MAPKPCSAPPAPRPTNLLPAHLPTTNLAGSLGLARSFELVKAELFAVPSHAIVPLEIDVPRSARAVLGSVKQLATLLPDLAKLGGYDLRPVRRLRFYAGAVLYTHVLALAAGPADLEKLAMRDAASVLFLQAYRHCRHGVMLLRWPENDAGVYLPELRRRSPWALDSRRAQVDVNGATTRVEPVMASPIRHREVPMD